MTAQSGKPLSQTLTSTLPAGTYKMLTICTLGCALETYDFMIYALMAPYISHVFFPDTSVTESLLFTFITFSLGYITRPLGGVIFGHIGDRKGRKKPFTATVLLMALSTALIGCLPDAETAGIILAPALLLGLRLAQGLSMGGEVGGALTYVQEILPKNKVMATGAVLCGMIFGLALGHTIHAILEILLSHKGMMDTGWRIAFWIGGGLGVVGYFIRRHFHETAGFLKLQQNSEIIRLPLATLVKSYRPQLLTATLCIMSHGINSIMFLIFLPTWASTLHPERTVSVALHSAIASVFAAVACIACGHLADRWGKKFVVTQFVLLIVLGPVLAAGILAPHTTLAFTSLILGSLMVGTVCGGVFWTFCQQFPAEVRYSGCGLSYNIGFALGGGLTPLLATWLITQIKADMASTLLLVLAGICGLSSYWLNTRIINKTS